VTVLGQTYLSRKTSYSNRGKLPDAKYVNVTKAFNPPLAPSEAIYDDYKASGKTDEAWEKYKLSFMQKILSDPVALEKIDTLIFDSLSKDVVLMCYESEAVFGDNCHRFLLLDIAEVRAKEKGIPIEIKRENYLI
jgi:hypothetical protein